MSLQNLNRVVVVFVIGWMLTTTVATADTIYVCWDGTGDYTTIQAGIDAAAAGDEVVVCDGTYTGAGNRDLDFAGKAITVRSASGDPAQCIIDCASGGRGFHFASGEGSDSIVEGLTITNGYAESGGGVFCTALSSPTLTNCAINGNSADYYGGGVYCHYSSNAQLTNCRISGNSAERGAGVYCSIDSNAALANCEISGNTASQYGGGVYCYSSANATLTDCTFSGNSATYAGGGVSCPYSTPTLINCILWGDTPQEIDDFSNPVLNRCDVQGGWPGPDNLDADPLFVDPDGPDDDPATWADNDYRPGAGSPCIDAGDNTAVPLDLVDLDGDGYVDERIPFDLDGNPRFVQDPFTADTGVPDPPLYSYIVDIGAYEFQFCLGDLDGDDDIDLADLAELLGSYGETTGMTYADGDLDDDGDVDLSDLSGLLSVYGTTCD
jgi:parallel beta-helix repeat protein